MEQIEKLKSSGFLSANSGASAAPESAAPNADVLNEIKMEVAGGKVISKILDKYKDKLLALNEDVEMEIMMLQGRSTRLEKDSRMGVISSENSGIERARITNALLALLDDIKDDL